MNMNKTKVLIDEKIEALKSVPAIEKAIADGQTFSKGDLLNMDVQHAKTSVNQLLSAKAPIQEVTLGIAKLQEAVTLYNTYQKFVRLGELSEMTWPDAMKAYLESQTVKGLVFSEDTKTKRYVVKDKTNGVGVDFLDVTMACKPACTGLIRALTAIYATNLELSYINEGKTAEQKESVANDPHSLHDASFITRENDPVELIAMRKQLGWNSISNNQLVHQLNSLVNDYILDGTNISIVMVKADMKYIRNDLLTNVNRKNKSGSYRRSSVNRILENIFRCMYTRYHNDSYRIDPNKDQVDMEYIMPAIDPENVPTDPKPGVTYVDSVLRSTPDELEIPVRAETSESTEYTVPQEVLEAVKTEKAPF